MEHWQERALNILEKLGGAPATSFYEEPVAKVIESTLTTLGIPYHKDEFGNIVAKLHSHATDQSWVPRRHSSCGTTDLVGLVLGFLHNY